LTSLLFKTLLTGLSLWKNKDSRKYVDRVIQLKKDWYEEYNKELQDDSVLDNIEYELRTIVETFSSSAGNAYLKDQ